VLRLVRGEEAGAAPVAEPQIPAAAILAARREIDTVTSAEAIEAYIVAIVAATRRPAEHGAELARWITIGASPRGSLALDRCSRVQAWMQGRDYVTPEDVQAVTHDCLRHRIALSYDARAEGVTADRVLDTILTQVAVAV